MIIPSIATLLYLEMPAWKHSLQSISKPHLFWFSCFHNLALSVFSGYVFYRTTEIIFFQDGFEFSHRFFFQRPEIKTLMWWVYMSKYYEFIDTALLYASGKTPIFLQKFHHVGAVIVWHLANIHECDFIFFVSWLNCGVHTIMYAYYLCSLFTRRIPRYIKQTITTMQICQLSAGPLILPAGYYYTETRENYKILMVFTAYVMYLLYLFGEFMLNTYFRPMCLS